MLLKKPLQQRNNMFVCVNKHITVTVKKDTGLIYPFGCVGVVDPNVQSLHEVYYFSFFWIVRNI